MELILIKLSHRVSYFGVVYTMAHYPNNSGQEDIAVYANCFKFSDRVPYALRYLSRIPALYDTSKIRNQATTIIK